MIQMVLGSFKCASLYSLARVRTLTMHACPGTYALFPCKLYVSYIICGSVCTVSELPYRMICIVCLP